MYEPFRCSSVTEEMWTLLEDQKVQKLPLARLETGMRFFPPADGVSAAAEETGH